MYSTLAVNPNAKHSGRLIGTHQRLDQLARKALTRSVGRGVYFPTSKEILHFEGTKGPDGLKRKSPGVDEPEHFILPGADDGHLMRLILDHQYNLHAALVTDNRVRAAFEAAWLAHAVTDGLTPAHHFPLSEVKEELMTEQDFVRVFGVPIKGIMHGHTATETLKNNWRYWGVKGYMSKHIAFEYGVASTLASLQPRSLLPSFTRRDLQRVSLRSTFYQSLQTIAALDMYTEFCRDGWTAKLVTETRQILLPEIIRAITLAWASAIPELNPEWHNE